MSILVDTGAWYALADTSDRHHLAAASFLAGAADSEELVTTDGIVVETWALIRSHLGRPAALKFWATLRDAATPILCIEPVDLEAAWHAVHSWPDQDFSFTDATSFAIMERLGITRCFSFDQHFLTYRFGPRRDRHFTRLPG